MRKYAIQRERSRELEKEIDSIKVHLTEANLLESGSVSVDLGNALSRLG
jgi:hypothetical protein